MYHPNYGLKAIPLKAFTKFPYDRSLQHEYDPYLKPLKTARMHDWGVNQIECLYDAG